MRVRSLYVAGWTVAWTTTYTFELDTYEGHLLSRLGGPPLNATVLADQDRLEALWRQMAGDDDLYRVRRAGRSYLLRGVDWTRNFHPKTYFFGRHDRGRLLIGSGNCGLRGLLYGNEIMASFQSEDAPGLAAIRQWRDWMQRLVHKIADPILDERWAALLSGLPWLAGGAASSSFVHNLDSPLNTQLADAVSGSVDELHLMAPFYDKRATVVAELIRDFKPRRVILYVGESVEVAGPSLEKVLRASGARVEVLRPQPLTYVHAKLIGAIKGSRGWLLSGSANLSRAALTLDAARGNCEAGTLVQASASEIRAFLRGTLDWKPVSIDELTSLQYPDDAPAVDESVRLLRATLRTDDRLALTFRTTATPSQLTVRVLFEDDEERGLLVGAASTDKSRMSVAVTEQALIGPTEPLAACIVADGVASGYVPIDDPDSLRAALEDTRSKRHPDPDDFTGADLDSPLGKLVTWIRDGTDFGPLQDDAVSAKTVPLREADIEASGEDDEVPVEDLELVIRRRVARHAFNRRDRGTVDDLLEEIAALRAKVPADQARLRLIGGPNRDTEPPEAASHWSPTRRLQMRFGNAVHRMCSAAGDRRVFDVDPVQAARNIETLIEALCICRFKPEAADFLSEERITGLAWTLVSGLAGSDEVVGLVGRLPSNEGKALLADVGATASDHLAELVLDVVAPAGALDRPLLYKWQPTLQSGLASGLVAPLAPETQHRLNELTTLTDDFRWPQTMRKLYHIDVSVRRGQSATEPTFLLVDGADHILDDPKLVDLTVSWFTYERGAGRMAGRVTVADQDRTTPSGIGPTRLVICLGETAFLKTANGQWESTQPVTEVSLGGLTRDRMPWRTQFPQAPRARSLGRIIASSG